MSAAPCGVRLLNKFVGGSLIHRREYGRREEHKDAYDLRIGFIDLSTMSIIPAFLNIATVQHLEFKQWKPNDFVII
jgi:hypothetical protein